MIDTAPEAPVHSQEASSSLSKESLIAKNEGEVANGRGTTRMVAEIIGLKYALLSERVDANITTWDKLKQNRIDSQVISAKKDGKFVKYCQEFALNLQDMVENMERDDQEMARNSTEEAVHYWLDLADKISEDGDFPKKFEIAEKHLGIK